MAYPKLRKCPPQFCLPVLVRVDSGAVPPEAELTSPTRRLATYERILRDVLRLQKNLKAEDWVAIGLIVASRPGVTVLLNGKVIPENKLKRYIRRYSNNRIRGEEIRVSSRPSSFLAVEGTDIETWHSKG